MGHWNYRLIRHDLTWGPEYTLHEVYYDDEGQPNGWGHGKAIWGETIEAAHKEYLVMGDAFKNEAFKIVDGELKLETYDG